MNEDTWALLLGIVIGTAAGITLILGLTQINIIDPCERNLPRSQSCELIAVPVEE